MYIDACSMNMLTSKEQVVWFTYYNNPDVSKDYVLTRNTTKYSGNVVVAKKVPNACKNTYMYAIFDSLDHFVNEIEEQTRDDWTYHSVLTEDYRYIYFDIDCKLDNPLSVDEHRMYSKLILQSLVNFFRMYGNCLIEQPMTPNWHVWDATRKDKLSLHMVDNTQMLHLEHIKYIASKFGLYLKNKLESFHRNDNGNKVHKLKVDLEVYKKGHQLWRLPLNSNGKKGSVLRLLDISFDPYLTRKEQFNINFMLNKRGIKNGRIRERQITQFNIPHTVSLTYHNKYDKKIIHKIRQVFEMKGKAGFVAASHNNEFIMQGHKCVIKGDYHQSNSGRLRIMECALDIHKFYCKYTCMDEHCQRIKTSVYINLSDGFILRPWIFLNVGWAKLDIDIVKEVDTFIDKLLNQKILGCDYACSNFINNRTILFNNNDYIFQSFTSDDVRNLCCGCRGMRLSYRSPNNEYIKYGRVVLSCNMSRQSTQCGGVNLRGNGLYFF